MGIRLVDATSIGCRTEEFARSAMDAFLYSFSGIAGAVERDPTRGRYHDPHLGISTECLPSVYMGIVRKIMHEKGYSEEFIAKWLEVAETQQTFVALDGPDLTGTFAGSGSVLFSGPESKEAYMRSIYIPEAYRKRDIGSDIFEKLAQHAVEERGAERATGACLVFDRSIAFSVNNGYEIKGTKTAEHSGTNLNLLRVRKNLV